MGEGLLKGSEGARELTLGAAIEVKLSWDFSPILRQKKETDVCERECVWEHGTGISVTGAAAAAAAGNGS